MDKKCTLGEIFAKSNADELNGYFDSEKFNRDVEQMSKAQTEQLLGQIQSEILKGGDYEVLTEMRSIALDHIEKARSGVYADTPQNRKLGRVGQKYGGKKSEDDKTPEWKKNALKILILLVSALYIFFVSCSHPSVSAGNVSKVQADNIVDTIWMYDNSKIDSLYKEIKLKTDSIRLFQDSVNIYRDTLQWENYANYINARRIEKVKYYISICEKRPANKKYFFGWIRRAVSE